MAAANRRFCASSDDCSAAAFDARADSSGARSDEAELSRGCSGRLGSLASLRGDDTPFAGSVVVGVASLLGVPCQEFDFGIVVESSGAAAGRGGAGVHSTPSDDHRLPAESGARPWLVTMATVPRWTPTQVRSARALVPGITETQKRVPTTTTLAEAVVTANSWCGPSFGTLRLTVPRLSVSVCCWDTSVTTSWLAGDSCTRAPFESTRAAAPEAPEVIDSAASTVVP